MLFELRSTDMSDVKRPKDVDIVPENPAEDAVIALTRLWLHVTPIQFDELGPEHTFTVLGCCPVQAHDRKPGNRLACRAADRSHIIPSPPSEAVGADVGFLEGRALGADVGDLVGDEGTIDGEDEGKIDGDAVGRNVGELVGDLDGISVGSALGRVVGEAEGPAVGASVHCHIVPKFMLVTVLRHVE